MQHLHWHHLVVTASAFESQCTASLYLDGLVVSSYRADGDCPYTDPHAVAGTGNSSDAWQIDVDDVRVYLDAISPDKAKEMSQRLGIALVADSNSERALAAWATVHGREAAQGGNFPTARRLKVRRSNQVISTPPICTCFAAHPLPAFRSTAGRGFSGRRRPNPSSERRIGSYIFRRWFSWCHWWRSFGRGS